MPDENGAPNGTSASTTEAPGSGQGFDFERAYREIQPEFTRRSQRLSEYEGLLAGLHDPDPEVQRAAADYLGIELVPEDTGTPAAPAAPGTSDEDEWVDPLEGRVSELAEQVKALVEQGQQEATSKQEADWLAKRDDYIDANLENIEAQIGRQLSDREDQVIGNLAIAMADEDDVPDVIGAFESIYGGEGVLEQARSQWIESKTSASQAPSLSTLPADKRPKTPAERIDYIDRRWRDMQDQQ